ncbi:DUF4270 domain-containing protein [Flavobacteriales bacterium]|jgi:hypothetical protein|nr:DUF4270 domain-containing protein [Flavobacteriales bacterium]MDA7596220.1 DUF4270 domain-containing protein [Flavobacteriales bacterium]MDC0909187.1 DUF4270 family protein [Flavobacteriales bacterium]
MNKIYFSALIVSFFLFSCTDPNTIGLEVQPASDKIILGNNNLNDFDVLTQSEDSIRTDKAITLILGEINDPVFGSNIGAFRTQILLTENNTDLGENPIVDSVILSYSYSGYYGELEEFSGLDLTQIQTDLHKDTVYYSNSYDLSVGSIDNIESFNLSDDSENPFIKIKLRNEFGQQIINLGSDILQDNESFLQEFKGLSILAQAENTMLYLNPNGTNSFLKIYYHNDSSDGDTLSLDFELGGDVARMNLFNQKNEYDLIQDQSNAYIQSMSGYKIKLSINNVDSIKSVLEDKVINRVSVVFKLKDGSQTEYSAHEKLVLVRINQDGDNVFLSDFTIGGDVYFGGNLENERYEFNITRYFFQLLNNESYTNDLYLLPAGAVVNSNRTIISREIDLEIYYSIL